MISREARDRSVSLGPKFQRDPAARNLARGSTRNLRARLNDDWADSSAARDKICNKCGMEFSVSSLLGSQLALPLSSIRAHPRHAVDRRDDGCVVALVGRGVAPVREMENAHKERAEGGRRKRKEGRARREGRKGDDRLCASGV